MLSIYTDGACKGNPGKGGWGFIVIQNDKEIYSSFGGVRSTTNNQMELTAILEALEYCWSASDNSISIFSDSAYIVNCLTQGWYHKWRKNGWKTSTKEPVKNKEFWEKILDNYEKLTPNFDIKFFKVKGHSDNYWNIKADILANKGAN